MITIFTCANIQNYREIRNEEYKEGLKSLLSLAKFLNEPNKIYILECFQKTADNNETLPWISLNNEFKDIQLIFSNTHKEARNKGVLEMLALRKILNKISFDSDEILMKQTGRYSFHKNLLSNYINEAKSKNLDGVVRYDEYGQVFFGATLLKTKHWKKFINELDFQFIEKNMINIELCLSKFLNENKIPVLSVPELGMKANIANGMQQNLFKDFILR